MSIDTSSVVAPDLLSQMRLGLQLQRCLDNEATHAKRKVPLAVEMTARDALIWGTRNGADALGLADQIGTLTPGKRADLVTISSSRALVPSANPLGTEVLQSSAANVDTVMVNGVIKKRHGELVGYDLQAIRARAAAASFRIQERVTGMPLEMTTSELEDFLVSSERSTRANFAQAYANNE